MGTIHGLDAILAEHPFFQGFSQDHFKLLVGCAANERCDAGQYLLREGEDATKFFLIRSGCMAIEAHAPGKESLVVQTVHSGEIFGLAWLSPPYRWTYDARATELTRLISIDGKCLLGKCDADHGLGYAVFKRFLPIMASRLAATRMQLLDMYGTQKPSRKK